MLKHLLFEFDLFFDIISYFPYINSIMKIEDLLIVDWELVSILGMALLSVIHVGAVMHLWEGVEERHFYLLGFFLDHFDL